MRISLSRSIKMIAVTLFVLTTAVVYAAEKAVEPMQDAPDFTLKSNRGDNVKLSELRGEVVLINFWASWCGPCREEMPALNDIYLKFRDKGLHLLGVNVEEEFEKGKVMVRDLKVVFPILLDSDNAVSKKYNVDAMPSTVLVDTDGKIRFIHQGYLPGYEDEYLKQVRELLPQ